MVDNIVQKVYYSIATRDVSQPFIEDILEPSRISNSKKGITGCLLYHDRIFLQLLEGDKKTVENLFQKISKDNRHKEVTLIFEEEVENRIFPNWTMAYHEFDKNDEEMKRFVKSIAFFSKHNEKPTDAIEFFWNMARQIVN